MADGYRSQLGRQVHPRFAWQRFGFWLLVSGCWQPPKAKNVEEN
jgi:2-polyprenyl-6-methoxyphenol hydroxylase-like FAD-dependent oxidoreductase